MEPMPDGCLGVRDVDGCAAGRAEGGAAGITVTSATPKHVAAGGDRGDSGGRDVHLRQRRTPARSPSRTVLGTIVAKWESQTLGAGTADAMAAGLEKPADTFAALNPAQPEMISGILSNDHRRYR